MTRREEAFARHPAPAGFEVCAHAEAPTHWRPLTQEENAEARLCGQRRCLLPARLVLIRTVMRGENVHGRRQFCCDDLDHSYGRWLEAGVVYGTRYQRVTRPAAEPVGEQYPS